jgi:hypothetical protein
MKLVTLKGIGVTITATEDVADRLMKSQSLGLKRAYDINDCEPGGCGTCCLRLKCSEVPA